MAKWRDIALENGLKFCVDWQKGQKTGFFVDQRENRSLLERYAKDRSVLNMFCYTGGFSFYAMRGGAKVVHSVDSSAKAISLTNKNVELNFPGDPRHEAYAEDAFKYLEKMGSNYDLIILDPPAFAKHKKRIAQRFAGISQTDAIAFEKIKPGRHPVHLLLLAGGKQGELPSGRVQCRRPVRTQCPYPAPTDTTRRPSGQHLPSGRGIFEGAGALCGVRRGNNL